MELERLIKENQQLQSEIEKETEEAKSSEETNKRLKREDKKLNDKLSDMINKKDILIKKINELIVLSDEIEDIYRHNLNSAGKAKIEIELAKRTIETFVGTSADKYKHDLNKIRKTHFKAIHKYYEEIIKNEREAKEKLEKFKTDIDSLEKQIQEFDKQQ
ncbi:hypothetical protein MSB_A0904 [Mycoplasma leachii PG50]|uniref:Uncharacterized protein n=1 Tax=Mycoplasma leachii (strain DSM 21131 / NCTC 10133 / N29 / PG50) TaxID=880447 RepID=E4PSU8_MYCLG|nr:hypothetical protein [Mycoplasma leachii]ADR24607.1 hypothetical protein MSB_A0904 [Mycoplasma leachii PG50]CBV67621.1 Viral A-type inclusion protein, putative [Mycoplasma leachii 99/014/6]